MPAFAPRLTFFCRCSLTLAVAAPALAQEALAPPAAPTFIPAAPVLPAPDATPTPVPTVESLPTPTPDPGAGSGFGASQLAIAALALAALGLGFLAGSRRRPRPAGPAAAAPAAPRRTAVAAPRRAERRRPAPVAPDPSLPSAGRGLVRSELDPDGYVELEGCLRRVRWAAREEPPAVGEYVRVEQRGHDLLAHGGRSR